ncbi:sporulation protein YjcZ [Paenibacillaceae bacterium]|nr:sporulation protein YjcZ [Paenibacillaceae bacterium]
MSYPGSIGGAGFTSIGVILVLFILLVIIISCAW